MCRNAFGEGKQCGGNLGRDAESKETSFWRGIGVVKGDLSHMGSSGLSVDYNRSVQPFSVSVQCIRSVYRIYDTGGGDPPSRKHTNDYRTLARSPEA